jgi:hypothetical protein
METKTTQYLVEEYIDSWSERLCECFYVLVNGNKVYERDYGSCPPDPEEMIDDYRNYLKLNYGN